MVFFLTSASMGGLGVDEVKWLIPVRPGDILSVRANVQETRASESRPDRGYIKFSFDVFAGPTRVMTLTTQMMFGRRSHTGALQ